MTNPEDREKSLVTLIIEDYKKIENIEPSYSGLEYISKINEENNAFTYNSKTFGDYVKKFGGSDKNNLFSALENYKKTLSTDLKRIQKYLSKRHSR